MESGWTDVQKVRFQIFRERRSSFSLDLRSFGPSVLNGARSKVDLFGGVPTTPRGRDLFLLVIFFG